MMLVDPFRSGVNGPAEINYVGQTSREAGTTVNYSSVPIGAEGPARRIFVVVHWYASIAANSSLTGVTIGGQSATVHIVGDKTQMVAAGFRYCAAIVSAEVATGSATNISISFNNSASGITGYVFRAINVASGVAIGSVKGTTETATGSVLCLVQADGILIAGGNFEIPASWSGVTKTYQDTVAYSGGCREVSSTATASITCTGSSGSALGFSRSLIAASFR